MSDGYYQPTQAMQPTQATQPNQASGPRMIAGRYALIGELGRGGMGVVSRAEDTVIGRHVAIKELRVPEGTEDIAVFQERVLREVRTGGRLNDPAVVTVYDVVTEGDATFIVMELVEAPTLSDVVRQHGPLPPHQVASIGHQVLSALQSAHAAGIVHRDVKPGNVMVAANGRVKLTDFGIAQAVDDPRITTSGMLVGSPAFMAPERVAGHDALPASDLWSLGAALFFAVEGVLPFERATTAATLHAIMNEVPYLTHAQGPLASAIMGLLVSNPDGRITAEQAQGLLGMAAQQQAASTPPGGQQHTMLYGAQPHTMVGGHTMLGAGQEKTRRPRARKPLLIGAALVGVGLLVAGFFLGKPVWSPAVDDAMLPTMTFGAGGDVPVVGSASSTDYRCLNTPLEQGRSIDDSNWVDCEEARHYAEYFWGSNAVSVADTYDDQETATYPGIERMIAFGEARCATAFHSNNVPAKDKENLRYQALVPTQQEWERVVDEDSVDGPVRSIQCFLMRADGGTLPDQPVAQLVR
ncbi:Serine/threonine protein kinase [Prauserella marina]|uniref:non-specific serine/threonine protein kinase n=2 Tax=Prauserella marina TaxID=530584 RepID=A0A1G6IY53_9PSEU|nr:Serine/threonine protein kinase [Prauserella marina]